MYPNLACGAHTLATGKKFVDYRKPSMEVHIRIENWSRLAFGRSYRRAAISMISPSIEAHMEIAWPMMNKDLRVVSMRIVYLCWINFRHDILSS
jgi:hypothetical protein